LGDVAYEPGANVIPAPPYDFEPAILGKHIFGKEQSEFIDGLDAVEMNLNAVG